MRKNLGNLRNLWILAALCLCASVAHAQNTRVTGTFKTQDQLAPSAAGLDILACVSAGSVALPVSGACVTGTPVYGKAIFRSVDTGRYNMPREITCSGITYPPQSVPGWIKSDGTLLDSAAVAGVLLIPTAGCTPTGLAYELELTLNGSIAQRRSAYTFKSYKAIPAQTTVDWASLASATASASTVNYQTQNAATILDYEDWTGIAAPVSPASGKARTFFNTASGKFECKDSTGLNCMAAGSGYQTIQDEGSALTARTIVNMTGAGVACVDNAGLTRTDCTIPGGGGSVPTGTGFRHITAGAEDAAAKLVANADVDAAAAIADSKLATISTVNKVAAAAIDDSGAASTQALFSGAAGSASFRAITDADVPDTLTASNYCALAGGAACTMTGDFRPKTVWGTDYWADNYADLQTAIDAAFAAGGGRVVLSANKTYGVPTAGLVLKKDVFVESDTPATAGTTALIDCVNATAAVDCVSSNTAPPDTYGLGNVRIKAWTGPTNSTLKLNGSVTAHHIVVVSGAGIAVRGIEFLNLRETASVGWITIGDSVANLACWFIGGPGTNAGYVGIYNLHCGTSGSSDGTLFDAAARLVFYNPQFWGSSTINKHAMNITGSTDIHVYGGLVLPENGGKGIVVDATSADIFLHGVEINSFFYAGTPVMLDISGDRVRAEDLKITVGTFTSPVTINAGGDNNYINGYILGTITDNGANNKRWIFDGTNWTGNLPDSILATIATAGKVSGAALTSLGSIPSGGGVLPVVNGGSGTGGTLTGLVRGSASAFTAAELSGDVTTSGSNVATLVNIPTGTTMAGNILATAIAAPATPASGKLYIWTDSTDARVHDKNASGVIGTTVVADAGAANNFLTAISAAGAISKARPVLGDINGGTAPAASFDFEGASVTRPFRRLAFASFPGTCTANREFLERSDPAVAGQVLYVCNSAGTGWDLVGDGGAGGSNHAILSATHTDTVAATVVRGDLMIGQGVSPTWQRKAIGAANTFLGSDATDATWTSLTLASAQFANQGSTTTVAHGNAAGNPSWAAVSLTADVSGILGSANGGTGNGFTKFTGPTTSEKTFTLPNASATVLTDNAAVTIPQGGTGTGSTLTGLVRGSASAMTAAELSGDVTTSGSNVTTFISTALKDSSTHTLTNKTLDVEGTGNVITTVSKIWIPAAICQNATATLNWDTPATSPAVAACVTGTNTQKGVADFADSANLSMQMTVALPSDFTGNVDAKFKWLTTATSGDVVWQLATICVADAETDDPAFNTASTVTDTAKGTTNQLNDASITSVTITGCAAGELMHLKLSRDSAHASDTLAATARLVGLELTMRRAQ